MCPSCRSIEYSQMPINCPACEEKGKRSNSRKYFLSYRKFDVYFMNQSSLKDHYQFLLDKTREIEEKWKEIQEDNSIAEKSIALVLSLVNEINEDNQISELELERILKELKISN